MKTKVLERKYLIRSPYQILREVDDLSQPEELAQHFQDLYKFYLRRLASFEMEPTADLHRENELVSILSELIKTKHLLQNSG